MEELSDSKSRTSPSAVLALGFPALLLALLVLVTTGMGGNLNPVEAGVYLLFAGPVCLVGGLVASAVAVMRRRRPQWAGVTGLVVNGLIVAYLGISLLLSA